MAQKDKNIKSGNWVSKAGKSNHAADHTTFVPRAMTYIGISSAVVTHPEGDSGNVAYVFTLTRYADTGIEAEIDYTVVGMGTNPANAADFGGAFPSGTITFASGDTEKTLTINVVGDEDVELTEKFKVLLTSDQTDVFLLNTRAKGTVTNDDTV